MAYDNGSENSNKLLTFKLKTKNVEKPYFEVKSKVDGKWTVLPEQPTNVSGNLVKLELAQDEYEGNVSDKAKIYLSDNERNETYLLDLYFTFATRSLFNSLLSLESFDNLKVSVYNTKPNDQGKVFAAVSLRQGDTRIDWKYGKDETPTTKRVTINKKEMLDSSELDNFYIEKLKELAEKVNSQKEGEAPKVEKKVTAAKEKVKEQAPVEDDSDIF